MLCRGISPPAGGEFLCPRRQRNQNAAGGRLRMDTSCPYSPYPRSPITGDALLFDVAEFPARKNGVASALPSGPLGPGFAKIAADAVQKLRLGFPNQRSRCWIRRRGGPCGRPRWIRNQLSVLFVGAAVSRPQAFPLQGGRCPRRGRMRVPSWLARPPAGGPRASPTRTRKNFLRAVGEGTTPLIKGRCRAQRDKGDRDLPLPTFQDTVGRSGTEEGKG